MVFYTLISTSTPLGNSNFISASIVLEVESRKANLIGSFQVSLSTSDGLAGTFLRTMNRGYPLDWVDDYPGKIRTLTAQQVNAAIKTYLQPQNMILVTAGSLSDIKK